VLEIAQGGLGVTQTLFWTWWQIAATASHQVEIRVRTRASSRSSRVM
jgi:hypothetical protein